MSLINDALKTAQRERGQGSQTGGGQPLLEGFFPYVSTATPEGRSRVVRLVVISAVGIVVLGAVAWFSAPAIKRLMAGSKKTPSIVLPPRTASSTPSVAKIPAVAQTPAPADTQSAPVVVAAAPDTTPAVAPAPVEPPKRRARPPKASPSEARSVAATSEAKPHDDSTPTRSVVSSASERRVQSVRPNLELDAVAAFNIGDYPLARTKFDAAVRSAPTASGWTNYGVTLEKLGDPVGAKAAYRSAMGIDPTYFNAWLYLARVTSSMGDLVNAVPLFNRARELDPDNSDVNADLAELEFKTGAFAEARQYAQVGVKSNPSNARAHYYLALAADTLKDRELARQAFTDYLRTIAGQEKDNAQSVGYARSRLQELKGRP